MDLQKIEAFRKRKDLTQEEFAKSLGVTATGYQKMIRNNDMKLSFFEKICITYQVSPMLFFDAETPTSVTMVSEPKGQYDTKLKTQVEYYKGLWEAEKATVAALNVSIQALQQLNESRKHRSPNKH